MLSRCQFGSPVMEVLCVISGRGREEEGTCKIIILTPVTHDQNIVITSTLQHSTERFQLEMENIISIDLNIIWSQACVLIPRIKRADGGRGGREVVQQRSLSAAWISYRVFYSKSAINQTACASQPSPGDESEDASENKGFIIQDRTGQ